jgi:hypothetical protein
MVDAGTCTVRVLFKKGITRRLGDYILIVWPLGGGFDGSARVWDFSLRICVCENGCQWRGQGQGQWQQQHRGCGDSGQGSWFYL